MMIRIKSIKLNEYLVLLIRLSLLLVFYAVFRWLFYIFNRDIFPNISFNELLNIFYGGVRFDLSAIGYLNLIYVLFYLFPLNQKFKLRKGYQRFLKILFLTVNGIGLAFNSIDIIYYRFILKRTTFNVKDILAHEQNLWELVYKFIFDFWYIFILFVAFMLLLGYGYSLFRPASTKRLKNWQYAIVSLVLLVVTEGLFIAAIRGGFTGTTRPITMNNAGRYVKSPENMAIVLNTPFCVIRTWGKRSYVYRDYFKDEKELSEIFDPIHVPDPSLRMKKKNIVIFILESFNREHSGLLNKNLDNGNYQGFTPFLDSLMRHGWTFTQAFANGRKSIDAIPSVVASIPSLVLPYVVSEYSTNKINGLARLLGKKGYFSAFFHGAPDGSMGFQSFASLAGYDKYFGKEEYNNDADYDGVWGIWDRKFFEFYEHEITKMKEPFFTTLFSVTSHHPFLIPEEFEGKYPLGYLPIHKCVGYTDDALRNFFNMAKKTDWYKNTLFVITADHSVVSHFKYSKTNLGAFAIPILFYAPGDSSMVRMDDRLAQQIDIMPTILHYINYNEKYFAFGRDLYENNTLGVVNYIGNNYQYINGDLVIYFDGEKITGVYNYKKDHYLKHNIMDSVDYYKYELQVKAIVQQYNNRMIENRLLP